MAGRLRVIVDNSDTIDVPRFSVPSGTKTLRVPITKQKQGEYIELLWDEGGTGGTTEWGIRAAVVKGLVNPREIDT